MADRKNLLIRMDLAIQDALVRWAADELQCTSVDDSRTYVTN
jgi:hypothetical protein